MPMLLTKLMAAGLGSGLANAFCADTADSQTATGTTQGTAFETSTAFVRFTTVASGTGCLLDNGARGDSQFIINAGANPLSVYPHVGGSINALGTNAAFSIPAGSWAAFDRYTDTLWTANNNAATSTFTQSGTAPSTGWATRTVAAKEGDVISVKDAKVSGGAAVAGDGVQDDSSAINAIFTAGYKRIYVPYTSGGYKIGSTISFTANDQELYFEPGAFFTFTGTGPCIDIGTSGTLQRCLVTNANITVAAGQTGIRIFRSLRCRLTRCYVKLTATGIAYDLDGNTLQNYYNYLDDCEVDNTNRTPPYTGTGIHLRNEANHNTITRGVIQYVDTGIQLAKTGGTSVSGNLIESTIVQNFQTFGINFPASATGTGNSIIGGWFENTPTTGTGINIADTTVVATFLLGNNYAGLTTNLNDLSDNTANRQTMQLDLDRQRIGNLLLEFNAAGGRIRAQRWARSAVSDQNLDIIGNGLNIYGAQDLTNQGLAIDGSGNVQMKTKGLSGTNTKANNLRGQATFLTAATVAVTFGVAETSNAYFVSISGNVNETFFVTAKGTGGFTLNSSNATSVAVVDWHLIR